MRLEGIAVGSCSLAKTSVQQHDKLLLPPTGEHSAILGQDFSSPLAQRTSVSSNEYNNAEASTV